ncbi:hypothetical protein [uncultured Alteromonas sp.]|uniref:hypothetical protein n=1 Tax=uncultured Alteromonas sp. TaxID=179113 RepID=UPI0030D03604
MSKVITAIVIFISLFPLALADVKVKGYYRSDGTYVPPHYRSDPNGTVNDNWTTYGNVNPHTGEIGTRRVRDSRRTDYNTSSLAELKKYNQTSIGYVPEETTNFSEMRTQQDVHKSTSPISLELALLLATSLTFILFALVSALFNPPKTVVREDLNTKKKRESKLFLISFTVSFIIVASIFV